MFIEGHVESASFQQSPTTATRGLLLVHQHLHCMLERKTRRVPLRGIFTLVHVVFTLLFFSMFFFLAEMCDSARLCEVGSFVRFSFRCV